MFEPNWDGIQSAAAIFPTGIGQTIFAPFLRLLNNAIGKESATGQKGGGNNTNNDAKSNKGDDGINGATNGKDNSRGSRGGGGIDVLVRNGTIL